MKKHIVKRSGHTEEFDDHKLYASVYNTLMIVQASTREAELIAGRVTEYVNQWLEAKHEVTSKDITHQAVRHLRKFNENAAYLYEHHRSVS